MIVGLLVYGINIACMDIKNVLQTADCCIFDTECLFTTNTVVISKFNQHGVDLDHLMGLNVIELQVVSNKVYLTELPISLETLVLRHVEIKGVLNISTLALSKLVLENVTVNSVLFEEMDLDYSESLIDLTLVVNEYTIPPELSYLNSLESFTLTSFHFIHNTIELPLLLSNLTISCSNTILNMSESIQTDSFLINGISIADMSQFTNLKYLKLNYLGLAGSIPVLPSTLISIDLTSNFLVGNLVNLPNSLQFVDLSNNTLSGHILQQDLPTALKVFKVSFNQFSGPVPQWPNTTTDVWLRHNQFNGSFPNITGYSSLLYLFIMDNHLSGPLSFSPSLRVLDASRNDLVESIPPLPSTLTALLVCGNKLTGTMPILSNLTLLFLGAPNCVGNKIEGKLSGIQPIRQIMIYDNLISDMDSILYSNVNSVRCDLRKNPLSSKLKGSLKNVGRCLFDDLQSSTAIFTTFTETATDVLNTFSQVEATSVQTVSKLTLKTSQYKQVSIQTTPIQTGSSVMSMQSTVSNNASTTAVVSIRSNRDPEEGKNENTDYLLYIILGCMGFLIIITIILGAVLKNPVIKSKFGRKNSFGTLNTYQSTLK